jgi:hypothetical protein
MKELQAYDRGEGAVQTKIKPFDEMTHTGGEQDLAEFAGHGDLPFRYRTIQ